MADTIYDKVRDYVEKYQMVKEGDLIAAGVSGGADSVCLLHLMRRLSQEIPYRLIVVHVNHGVRAEAAEDAAYVEGLCKRLGIPFYLREVDMNGYAAAQKISPEEAGRQLRYKAFEEVLEQCRQGEERCRIAVAHNAEDRAETMLFHLFRGSGLKGLSSIPPVRDMVIRPVLCLERMQIEDYLAEYQLKYCQDCTNETDDYTRNKIRHHILSYARQEICSESVAHMNGLADMLLETEHYLAGQAENLYKEYVEETRLGRFDAKEAAPEQGKPTTDTGCLKIRIRGAELLTHDPVIYRKVLLMCMEKLTPHRKDITGRHIADLVNLIGKNGSKELSLPYGIKAYKEYGMLTLCRDSRDIGKGINKDIDQDTDQNVNRNMVQNKSDEAAERAYEIKPPMEIYVPNEGTYTFSILEKDALTKENQQNIPQNRYTKWFDYDKITTTALLRKRQQGDYLTIDTALHTKSVKQYMINEKIPLSQRDSMHILADGPHILWIPGYRISERYKVEESTKRILQVQLRGGRHGRTN
ncbi:MAG: tRNA lysidine(34) synthetase TilS [Eubacterium sp.]|nr:tRNA lysidine(34) synthetase TilS [Eubacterium sp.]